jgi:hypothetical protein
MQVFGWNLEFRIWEYLRCHYSARSARLCLTLTSQILPCRQNEVRPN